MAKRKRKTTRPEADVIRARTGRPVSEDNQLQPVFKRWFDVSKPKNLILLCLLLGLVVGLVYLPVLGNDFVKWDDDITLYKNPNVQGLGIDHLSWMFTDVSTMRYKPLAWLSLGLIHAVGGLTPFAYHLV